MSKEQEKRLCPDCGVKPGGLHNLGCDVERCPDCGGQKISCECRYTAMTIPRLPWSGEWPGVAECREFGWYAKLIPGEGWVSCDKNDTGAKEDLNRLVTEAVWDRKQGRFILPKPEKKSARHNLIQKLYVAAEAFADLAEAYRKYGMPLPADRAEDDARMLRKQIETLG